MTKNKNYIKNLSRFIALIAILVLINIIGKSLHFRIDLTKEKRYTLTDETKAILENLSDDVFIRVYLDGELNIPLTNFQRNITEMLDELRIASNNKIHFELSDPFADTDLETKSKIMEELYQKGLRPINIHHRKKDGSVTEKIIIPGAIVSFNGIEIPLNLLLNDPSKSSDDNLNNSIEALEYSFINSIKNITSTEVSKIAFLEGHGEWPEIFVSDISQELSKSFQVDRGIISGTPGILDPYECIVIAGPVSTFSEADKYVIDQYIMNGGKVLWLIDGVNVDFDSLASGFTAALPNNLNLDDMLFRYGARINAELARDVQCGALKVNVALAGNEPNFQLAPWLYYPMLSPNKEHVISSNLNMVLSRFTSHIDTIEGRSSIKKTPLLQTSAHSNVVKTPSLIMLEEINEQPNEADFNRSELIVGLLLEGEFESVFKNRMLTSYFETPPTNSLTKSKATKMVVIADADIIKNDVVETPQGPSILPLGFDRSTNQTYGNKDFVINLVNYLTDDANLLSLRGREFKLRMLDKKKVNEQRLKWQLINVLLPIIIVIISGIAYTLYRKQIYTR